MLPTGKESAPSKAGRRLSPTELHPEPLRALAKLGGIKMSEGTETAEAKMPGRGAPRRYNDPRARGTNRGKQGAHDDYMATRRAAAKDTNNALLCVEREERSPSQRVSESAATHQ